MRTHACVPACVRVYGDVLVCKYMHVYAYVFACVCECASVSVCMWFGPRISVPSLTLCSSVHLKIKDLN